MFQSFPLGDKSSVNLRGAFHVENVTTFEEFLQDSGTTEDLMQVDTSGPETAATEGTKSGEQTDEGKSAPVDIDSLYPVFWSLQHSFSNPLRLFEQDYFMDFRKSLQATLDKFKASPTVNQAGGSDRRKGQNERTDDNYDAFANTYNPKYLTSRDLFSLEVRHRVQTWLKHYN